MFEELLQSHLRKSSFKNLLDHAELNQPDLKHRHKSSEWPTLGDLKQEEVREEPAAEQALVTRNRSLWNNTEQMVSRYLHQLNFSRVGSRTQPRNLYAENRSFRYRCYITKQVSTRQLMPFVADFGWIIFAIRAGTRHSVWYVQSQHQWDSQCFALVLSH